MGGPSWDKMQPKDIARLRERALHRQVRYQLYAYSPFYRKLMDEAGIKADDFRDLSSLPLVDRTMLAASPLDFYLRPTRPQIQRWGAGRQVAEVIVEMVIRGSERSEQLVRSEYEKAHTLQTAGIQGRPLSIHLSRYDLVTLSTQGRRMLEVAGVEPSDILLNLLEPVNYFWPAWLAGVGMGLRQSAPGRIAPQEAVELVSKMQATVIIATAQDALAYAEAAGRGLSTLKTIILAPEQAGPALRQQIQSKAPAAVKVLASYYFAEGRAWWVECAEGGASSGYHTYPDLEMIEMISPDSKAPVAKGGPAEVIFTGLDQRGTAVARYRPGDLTGGLMTGACSFCGRSVDRIAGPISRVGAGVELRLGDSEFVSLDRAALTAAMAHPGLDAWDVEIMRPADNGGRDDCYVIFRPDEGKDPARLAVELDVLFRSTFGFSPTQFVMSDRPQGRLVDLR